MVQLLSCLARQRETWETALMLRQKLLVLLGRQITEVSLELILRRRANVNALQVLVGQLAVRHSIFLTKILSNSSPILSRTLQYFTQLWRTRCYGRRADHLFSWKRLTEWVLHTAKLPGLEIIGSITNILFWILLIMLIDLFHLLLLVG